MEDIEAGQVQIHPSRQPIYKKKLSNAMNNVQRMLLLKGGAEGEWNPRAQMRLESLLANPSLLWSRTWNCLLATNSQMLKTYHWPWKMAIQTHRRIPPQIPIHLPARLKKMPLWRIPLTHPTRTSSKAARRSWVKLHCFACDSERFVQYPEGIVGRQGSDCGAARWDLEPEARNPDFGEPDPLWCRHDFGLRLRLGLKRRMPRFW